MRHGFMIFGVGALILIGAVGIFLASGQKEMETLPATASRIGGPFALTDSSGQAVTEQTYRGKWLLVFFGFTFCPDVCPTALSEVAATLHDLGPLADRVQPIFVSIDPERDSPARMAEYTQVFDPRIAGLTGTAEQVAVAARVYGAFYRKSGDGPDYTMDHSAIIYVMNPEGRFVTSFNHQSGAEKMVKALRPLLSKS